MDDKCEQKGLQTNGKNKKIFDGLPCNDSDFSGIVSGIQICDRL
jgi:hypothetical protein